MNIIQKMQAENEKDWKESDYARKEQLIAIAIVELAYDKKLSLNARRNIQRLILRLDDYERLLFGGGK